MGGCTSSLAAGVVALKPDTTPAQGAGPEPEPQPETEPEPRHAEPKRRSLPLPQLDLLQWPNVRNAYADGEWVSAMATRVTRLHCTPMHHLHATLTGVFYYLKNISKTIWILVMSKLRVPAPFQMR